MLGSLSVTRLLYALLANDLTEFYNSFVLHGVCMMQVETDA
jgi:hypothetical protein